MPDTPDISAQEGQTDRFLKTDGPAPGAFDLNDDEKYLLHGKTDFEKKILESVLKSNKQNDWIVRETVGLKGAHRVIHTRLAEGDKRFETIEKSLAVFTELREKWLTRKKYRQRILIGALTLLILPFIGSLTVEWLKHIFDW
jgi:hypothetical protein